MGKGKRKKSSVFVIVSERIFACIITFSLLAFFIISRVHMFI